MLCGYPRFNHVCLAALGTFLLARRIGLGRGAALAPAIAYPISSVFVVAAGQGYSDVVVTWALFPFLLLASEAASQSAAAGSRRAAARWSAAGGLVLGLLLLGGSPAPDVAALLAWSLWGLLRLVQLPAERRGRATVFAASAGLGVGLALAFWLPALLAVRQAGGLPGDVVKFLQPGGWEIAGWLAPLRPTERPVGRHGRGSTCRGGRESGRTLASLRAPERASQGMARLRLAGDG